MGSKREAARACSPDLKATTPSAPQPSSIRGRPSTLSRTDNVACVSGADTPRVVPFRWGRIDVLDCEFDENRHPDSEGNLEVTMEWAVTQLGLTNEETVALMGAHTLGRAVPANSGYDGAPRPDSRSTTYTSAFE